MYTKLCRGIHKGVHMYTCTLLDAMWKCDVWKQVFDSGQSLSRHERYCLLSENFLPNRKRKTPADSGPQSYIIRDDDNSDDEYSDHDEEDSYIPTYLWQYINSLKPEVPPEVVLVYPMCNVKHATLCVGANGYLFACEEEIELNDFIGHKELTVFSLTDFCRRALGEQNWNSLCRGDISLKIIQALTYHANEESGIGKGSHHAMKKTRRRKQRFDFIFIQLENGDNQLAQIVSMLQLTFENDIKYFCIVQYMEPCEVSSLAFFPKYRWEVRYNRRRQQIFCHDIIDFENILDTAFIIPDFAHDVIAGEPNTIDRFWYIPRKFFDRCGWNDLENADYNQTEDMEVYMNRNGSGAIEMQRNIIQENNHAANNMINSDTDDLTFRKRKYKE